MIIIYHLDEKNSIPFGQLMFERGFNNVFLLTGGIFRNEGVEEFIKEHRELVEGSNIPVLKKNGTIITLDAEPKKVVYQRSNETKDSVSSKIMQKEQLKPQPVDDAESVTSKVSAVTKNSHVSKTTSQKK